MTSRSLQTAVAPMQGLRSPFARVRRVLWARIAWGSVMPDAMPSLADSDWIRIAIRFDKSSTHSSM